MLLLKYVGKTGFRLLTLLVAISVIAFALMALAPIDPKRAYLGTEKRMTQEKVEQVEQMWGLDKPPVERFFIWGGNLLKGDWGESIVYKQPVLKVILDRFQYSFVLMLIAWTCSGLFGFLIGIIAGVYRGSILDQCIKTFCLTLSSAPTFWIGILVLLLFAVKLGWFPIGLAAPVGKTIDTVTLGERIHHLILPSLTLSILGIAKITLYTRQKMIEVLQSDFVLFARARGESTCRLVFRHGIRNIALPAITVQFAAFSELFGGISLAETVFSYPGLGSATTAAGINADVPLLLGIAVFSAIFVFAGNLTANILYGILDPRIREGESHVQKF